MPDNHVLIESSLGCNHGVTRSGTVLQPELIPCLPSFRFRINLENSRPIFDSIDLLIAAQGQRPVGRVDRDLSQRFEASADIIRHWAFHRWTRAQICSLLSLLARPQDSLYISVGLGNCSRSVQFAMPKVCENLAWEIVIHLAWRRPWPNRFPQRRLKFCQCRRWDWDSRTTDLTGVLNNSYLVPLRHCILSDFLLFWALLLCRLSRGFGFLLNTSSACIFFDN